GIADDDIAIDDALLANQDRRAGILFVADAHWLKQKQVGPGFEKLPAQCGITRQIENRSRPAVLSPDAVLFAIEQPAQPRQSREVFAGIGLPQRRAGAPEFVEVARLQADLERPGAQENPQTRALPLIARLARPRVKQMFRVRQWQFPGEATREF